MAYDLSAFVTKTQATIAALPATPNPKALLLIAKAIEGTTPSVALSDVLAASTAQQAIITAQGSAAVTAIHTARDEAITAIQQAGQGSAAASGIAFAPAGQIGATNVQSAIAELDAEKQPLATALTAIGALTPAADRLPYFTGPGAGAVATFTAAARALLDDADAATMLRTLGLTDGAGKLLASLMPALAITDVFPVASQAEMLALTAQRGDVAIRTDQGTAYILATDDAAVLANWKALPLPAGVVMQVAGLSGPSITGAQLIAALAAFGADAGAGGTKGLVPAPAAGDAAAGKFLKADGTWAVPPGSGSSGGSAGGITDDDRMSWIYQAETRATALRLASSVADDFKDQSGYDVANSVNVYWNSSGGLVSNASSGPAANEDLAPMTGNNAPSGQSAGATSALASPASPAWYLYDGSNATAWSSTGASSVETIFRTTANARREAGFVLRARADVGTYMPVNLTYWGSNNGGTTKDTLFTLAGAPAWAAGEERAYTIPTDKRGSYTTYGVTMTSTSGSVQYFDMAGIKGLLEVGGAMDLRSATFADTVVPVKASVFYLVKVLSGVLTLNTNLIAKVSRDGGTTETAVTLQNMRTLPSGYMLIEANNVDISAQPSGSSLKYRLQTVGTSLMVAIAACVFSWG